MDFGQRLVIGQLYVFVGVFENKKLFVISIQIENYYVTCKQIVKVGLQRAKAGSFTSVHRKKFAEKVFRKVEPKHIPKIVPKFIWNYYESKLWLLDK